ncbi:MAG TPA: hypothetical protein VH210_05055 [Gaiellaceae bacterium]|nr:hypothetical protein [Gaiellaceae bacterium]
MTSSTLLPSLRRPGAASLGTLLLVVDVCSTAGILVLAGLGPATAWVLVQLTVAWWIRGARDGLRLKEALTATVALAVAANFVTSWFGLVGGVPVGALVRDSSYAVLIAAGTAEFTQDRGGRTRLVAYLVLVAVVFITLGSTVGIVQITGARTYVLYPALLLGAAWRLDDRWRLSAGRLLVAVLLVLAAIGLAEVATHGHFLDVLGFRPDFAETTHIAAKPYFAGFRRATGGLGNFLEFGLLMCVGLLLSRAVLRGRLRVLIGAVFAAAAFLSWSRTAWALVVLIALIPLEPVTGAWRGFAIKRLAAGALVVVTVVSLLLAFGPSEIARQRLHATDRVTALSDATRSAQLSAALSVAGGRVLGTGPGSEGAAADRQAAATQRVVTDNGYLIWLLELGWLGLAAIAVFSLGVAAALYRARAWWALVLLGSLAFANALFAASDSRVVLAISFIALRLLWPATVPEARAR